MFELVTTVALALQSPLVEQRKAAWDAAVTGNGGAHPSVGDASTRLLNRMRCSAVSAVQGAGMHPGGSLWVSEPRAPAQSGFKPSNTHRDG